MGPLLGGAPSIPLDPAKTNIVFAGNSIVVGDAMGFAAVAGDKWPARLAAIAPINGAFTIPNLGHNGWGISALDGAGDTSPNFVPGKTNILLFYEGTNTLKGGGVSAQAAFNLLKTYITNRLAEHPWKIVLISTIPFIEGASDAVSATQNANVVAFNALMASGYRAAGAVAYIDVCSGAAWGNMPDYTRASFETYCSSLFVSDFTHPSIAGTHLLAELTAKKIGHIRLR